MADTNTETHAQLVEILRRGITDTINRYPNDLPDRLEAAHERELAAGGNAAKLREALKAAELGLFRWQSGSMSRNDHRELVAMIKTALAAPPRNCDRPECATVQGADEEFCKAGERDHSLGMCWEDLCYWLLAPATEKEGGVK